MWENLCWFQRLTNNLQSFNLEGINSETPQFINEADKIWIILGDRMVNYKCISFKWDTWELISFRRRYVTLFRYNIPRYISNISFHNHVPAYYLTFPYSSSTIHLLKTHHGMNIKSFHCSYAHNWHTVAYSTFIVLILDELNKYEMYTCSHANYQHNLFKNWFSFNSSIENFLWHNVKYINGKWMQTSQCTHWILNRY